MGLAVLVVAVAVAVELAVELLAALPFLPCFAMAWSPAGVLVVEVAVALYVVGMVAVGTSVGVVAKTLQNRHCFDDVQDPFDAVATGRRHFHVHCLHLRLESVEAVVLCVNHYRCDFHWSSPRSRSLSAPPAGVSRSGRPASGHA